MLDSHPSITCYEELFNVTNTRPNSFYSFSRDQYPNLSFFFLRRKIARSSLNFPLDFMFRQYIQELYQAGQKHNVGFRLVYDQLLYYRSLIKWITKNNIPIIHLQRTNLLKVVVSLLKAHQTKVYTSTSMTPKSDQKIKLQPSVIVQSLEKLSQQQLKCERVIQGNPVLSITYEDLFEQQKVVIGKISSFFNLTDASFSKPDIVKTNPEHLNDVVENYDEVRRALRGARWEKFLD
jgi:hypothetical protein